MADPIVMIETNRVTGRVEGVGLFSDLDKARYHAFRHLGQATLFSVWTPNMDSVIPAPSITGLSMPPVSK